SEDLIDLVRSAVQPESVTEFALEVSNRDVVRVAPSHRQHPGAVGHELSQLLDAVNDAVGCTARNVRASNDYSLRALWSHLRVRRATRYAAERHVPDVLVQRRSTR